MEVPSRFRELREAGKDHFHLSWYLSDAVVTSYGPKSPTLRIKAKPN